jgi:hypothetical protein
VTRHLDWMDSPWLFFQACWVVVKDDVMAVFLNSSEDGN